jgi:hypothetical protein
MFVFLVFLFVFLFFCFVFASGVSSLFLLSFFAHSIRVFIIILMAFFLPLPIYVSCFVYFVLFIFYHLISFFTFLIELSNKKFFPFEISSPMINTILSLQKYLMSIKTKQIKKRKTKKIKRKHKRTKNTNTKLK